MEDDLETRIEEIVRQHGPLGVEEILQFLRGEMVIETSTTERGKKEKIRRCLRRMSSVRKVGHTRAATYVLESDKVDMVMQNSATNDLVRIFIRESGGLVDDEVPDDVASQFEFFIGLLTRKGVLKKTSSGLEVTCKAFSFDANEKVSTSFTMPKRTTDAIDELVALMSERQGSRLKLWKNKVLMDDSSLPVTKGMVVSIAIEALLSRVQMDSGWQKGSDDWYWEDTARVGRFGLGHNADLPDSQQGEFVADASFPINQKEHFILTSEDGSKAKAREKAIAEAAARKAAEIMRKTE